MITSTEEFIALCESSDPSSLQRSISDSAQIELWLDLIDKHHDRWVDVAQNRTIPPKIIEKLAACSNGIVRAIIAEKRTLPVELFSVLAGDADEVVRRKIASNGKTPMEILAELTKDPIRSVSDVAQYNFNLRSDKDKPRK